MGKTTIKKTQIDTEGNDFDGYLIKDIEPPPTDPDIFTANFCINCNWHDFSSADNKHICLYEDGTVVDYVIGEEVPVDKDCYKIRRNSAYCVNWKPIVKLILIKCPKCQKRISTPENETLIVCDDCGRKIVPKLFKIGE